MNKASQLAMNAIKNRDIPALKEALTLAKSFSKIRITEDDWMHNVMEYAVSYKDIEAVKAIYEYYGSASLKGDELIQAAGLGLVDIVDLFISWNDDVNGPNDYDDHTPLHMAAQEGQTEVVKHLLAAGADKWLYNCEDDFGQSALYVAAAEGNTDIVEILLSDGVPDEHRQQLVESFVIAGVCDNFEVVELLLHSGVDINGVTSDGRPLLFYALVYGKKKLVDYLLNNGASLDMADNYGIGLRHLYEDPAFLRKISYRIKRGFI